MFFPVGLVREGEEGERREEGTVGGDGKKRQEMQKREGKKEGS